MHYNKCMYIDKDGFETGVTALNWASGSKSVGNIFLLYIVILKYLENSSCFPRRLFLLMITKNAKVASHPVEL